MGAPPPAQGPPVARGTRSSGQQGKASPPPVQSRAFSAPGSWEFVKKNQTKTTNAAVCKAKRLRSTRWALLQLLSAPPAINPSEENLLWL